MFCTGFSWHGRNALFKCDQGFWAISVAVVTTYGYLAHDWDGENVRLWNFFQAHGKLERHFHSQSWDRGGMDPLMLTLTLQWLVLSSTNHHCLFLVSYSVIHEDATWNLLSKKKKRMGINKSFLRVLTAGIKRPCLCHKKGAVLCFTLTLDHHRQNWNKGWVVLSSAQLLWIANGCAEGQELVVYHPFYAPKKSIKSCQVSYVKSFLLRKTGYQCKQAERYCWSTSLSTTSTRPALICRSFRKVAWSIESGVLSEHSFVPTKTLSKRLPTATLSCIKEIPISPNQLTRHCSFNQYSC